MHRMHAAQWARIRDMRSPGRTASPPGRRILRPCRDDREADGHHTDIGLHVGIVGAEASSDPSHGARRPLRPAGACPRLITS